MTYSGTATKKPILINWFCWNCNFEDLHDWVHDCEYPKRTNLDLFFEFNDTTLKVKILEGTSYDVPEGYIIIRGIEGEYYPCEPKIFEKTYDIIKVL